MEAAHVLAAAAALVVVTGAALVVPRTASAGSPASTLVVPGFSIGGVALGMTRADRPSITLDTYTHLFHHAAHTAQIRQQMAESEFGTLLTKATPRLSTRAAH